MVALVAVAGCSFATMRSPHGSPPECVDTQAAPFVDIVVAVASPFVAYAILRSSDNSMNPDDSVHRFFLAMGAVLVSSPAWAVFGTSSIYGFVKADRCYRAKRDYQQLMNASPPPG